MIDLPLLCCLIAVLFISELIPSSESIPCTLSFTPVSSTLSCYDQILHNNINFEVQSNHSNISSDTLPTVIESFLEMETSENLLTFMCEQNIVFTVRNLSDKYILNNCSNDHIPFSNYQNAINLSTVTDMEISNFKNSTFLMGDYLDILSVSLHNNIFDCNISKNNLILPHSLKNLVIRNNVIHFLPEDIFLNLLSLRKLEMSGNRLNLLNQRHFEHLYNLTDLHLSDNILEFGNYTSFKSQTVDLFVFDKLIHLRELNLSINAIQGSSLYKYLRNLNELHVLDISKNRIYWLRESTFCDVPKLEYLDLGGNHIEELPESIFMKLDRLYLLDIRHNKINSLPANIFRNLGNLEYLDISHNELRLLQALHFKTLKKLEYLNLSGNKIHVLHKSIIQNISNLKVFNVSHNLIRYLKISVLDNLSNLHILDASKNKIVNVYNPENVFVNVSEVNLGYNKINSFTKIKYLSPFLENLILDHNTFENLDILNEFNCSVMSQKNFTLSLRYNEISHVNVFLFINKKSKNKSKRCFKSCFSKTFIDISFNPFSCSGISYPFHQFLNRKSKFDCLSFINVEKLKCNYPESLKGKTFHLLPDTELEFPLTEDCPTQCNCGIRAKDRRVYVNCTKLHLHKVIENPPVGTSILFFSQNQLRNLSSLNSKLWINLTDLTVEDNHIGTLDGWTVPPNLKYLSLRGNRLKTLSQDLFEYIQAQDDFELLFGKNDRKCDCDSDKFRKFLINNKNFVKDMDEIMCDLNREGKSVSAQLISIPYSQLCADEIAAKFIQTVLVSMLTSICILFVAVIVLYLKLRFVIHSFLFTYCNKIFCFNPDENDLEEKLFDAFVAYSNRDRNLVMDLLNGLEEKEPHYKLCIHERNWVPGKFISENIVSSVQNSKRTIIIMSESFISSPWFKTELNAAVSKDQMNPFIVILADTATSLDIIDKHFRRVICKKTYLVWGERWFWEKLRYAMPRKNLETVA